MSTATEIERISTARNTIRNKMVELWLATSTAKIDALATAVDGIANRGSVSATVQEGDTYTIPAGYHNGSGTVSGIAGGGNYTLQSKTATPTKNQQSVTPDSGYYGLSDVTVAAIPEAYQDVSSVTAAAGDVLATKVFVTATGSVTTGTMANNGAVNKTLDATANNQEYTVPAGYHSGSGKVKITLETKTATPTTASQDVTPTSGKVLSKVTVNPIPGNFADVSEDDVTAADILAGKAAHGYDSTTGEAVEITGSMANNGAVSQTLDVRSGHTSYTVPAGYHNGSGKVQIVNETKTATPSASSQTITPTAGKVLSQVTVNAIPSNYADVTDDTAKASELLYGKTAHTWMTDTFGNSYAAKITGTMPNRGAASKILDATTDNQSYTVQNGYHNGSGKVQIILETKTATPTTSSQNITPTSGKVLSKVTVNAIPSKYKDTTNADAVAADVLSGKVFVNGTGEVTGTMANNGAIAGSIDGLTTTSYTVPAGYTSGGTVSLTNDIETALAAI
jgi:hypothetical protein